MPQPVVLSGTFAATGQSGQFHTSGPFNLSLSGTFVGTVKLERSFDSGATWLPRTTNGTAISFTAPVSEQLTETEANVAYRLNCTAWTSGTITYRLSR